MKSGKGPPQEDEGEEKDEFGSKKDVSPSANNSKDGKNSDKASAIRSKHSVTEQRRRSKINERFSILRELIPHSDQKRDTASFLLEVIEYVQFLQEKVNRYEGSYQPWSSEPVKLMPWRNSHWRNFASQSPTVKNGSDPAFPIRFDENSAAGPATVQPGLHNQPIEPEHGTGGPFRPMGPVFLQGTTPVSIENDGPFSNTLHGPGDPLSDSHSTECPDAMNLPDDLMIEGGTISISSVYSQGLLNSLSQALQSTGVDLSEASISVQINLGKRAQRGSIAKDQCISMPSGDLPGGTFQDKSNSEDLDEVQKRQKI
ncbi:basic helix-loop-helix (bHLH) DNA-bindingsuperfamily protein [Striga asiatica]|uniref:Basic helix-loop-helix (BHLH) DNA-bindingsuperfamily protein n=1 Tax=Striga asiatica TaxID=4170 RepID=A0A5A7PGY5_STRAF|nr:basic helix-loop-helix (bHLH) DNA-bindingsuperfamily protein [Striga asiatica]